MSSQAPIQILRTSGTAVKDAFIVKLKEGTDKQAHFADVNGHIAHLRGLSEITHAGWHSHVFHGYAGYFSDESLEALLSHTDVEYIEEDAVKTLSGAVTQPDAPWGISRISRNEPLDHVSDGLLYPYKFDSSAGKGVDIYIVDTGIYTEHSTFKGRASWGHTFAGTPGVDKNGHGTHCAGTAGSELFGVAKEANLIALKVAEDENFRTATEIDALNWIIQNAPKTHRPSVVSISTEGPYSKAENDVVDKVTAAGIHVVVSAGNASKDAKNTSPASAKTAITVGNITGKDARHALSKYGDCVNIYAPGTDIRSCGTSNRNAERVMTGSSMACPHVAGLVAYLIGKEGNKSPAKMADRVKELSLQGMLANIPSGSHNALARNDYKR